ncbi:MAG TPA: hypothetical protein VIN59_06075 [Alphaproteobacteria bacterium]
MGLSRRAFLKNSASAGAGLFFQRHAAIVQALGKNAAPLLTNRIDKAFIPEYVDLLEAIIQIVWSPDDPYPFSGKVNSLPLNLDLPFTHETLATLSQNALKEAYRDTVSWLSDCTIELFHMLKFGDDIPAIVQLLKDNPADAAKVYDYSEAMWQFSMSQIERGYADKTAFIKVVDDVQAGITKSLDMIAAHLKPDSLQELATETFLRVPGTDLNIPYLFNPKHMSSVMEAISIDYNGMFANMLDVPEDWQALFKLAEQSDEAKNTLAKWIIRDNGSYFNLDLAEKAGLDKAHFDEGLKRVIQQETEYTLSMNDNSADALSDRIDFSNMHIDQVREDLDDVFDMIKRGDLKVESFGHKDDAQKTFRFTYTGPTDPARLYADIDAVCNLLGFMLSNATYTIERNQAHIVTVFINENDHWKEVSFLSDYAEYCVGLNTTSAIRTLMHSGAEIKPGFGEILTAARLTWPQLRI